ncbi:hypothetical protein AURDEDRAFT_164210 [Auricularia subglabra TFB-10046 SS5]|nr:hypothetical protein AURDEDRAFT_164210 [Auricularia subglabra TFB-10046 SS5]
MPSPAEINFVNTCLSYIPLTLFAYDWVLTSGDEIQFIWSGNLKGINLVFLALRYGTLGLLVWDYAPSALFNTLTLQVQTLVSVGGMLLVGLVVQVLLQVRLYAIYNRSRIILWTNSVLTIVVLILTVMLYLVLTTKIKDVSEAAKAECLACGDYPRTYAVEYIAPLVFELYLAALAVRKAWINRDSLRELGNDGILEILVRGSVQYFALMASGAATSMILFLAAPNYTQWVDVLSIVISAVGGTRLIISMRRALLVTDNLTAAETVEFAGQLRTDLSAAASGDTTFPVSR